MHIRCDFEVELLAPQSNDFICLTIISKTVHSRGTASVHMQHYHMQRCLVQRMRLWEQYLNITDATNIKNAFILGCTFCCLLSLFLSEKVVLMAIKGQELVDNFSKCLPVANLATVYVFVYWCHHISDSYISFPIYYTFDQKKTSSTKLTEDHWGKEDFFLLHSHAMIWVTTGAFLY